MYQAGWSKREIAIVPRGYAMQGYGMAHHVATGVRSPLFARSLYLADGSGGNLIFCCLDLGYVTHAMREGAAALLRERMGAAFNDASFVLTCTHTHSGPGGCSHDAMYNLVTPGFVPEHVQRIVEAVVEAVTEAWRTAAATTVELLQGGFDAAVPVAWNRSLAAYNRNPEVTPRPDTETHLALDRGMQVLALRRDGRTEALLSLFGVHATCIGSARHNHDGDNKGRAALQAEAALQQAGAAKPVAIFAQATAGDVSPHYQGPGDVARRRQIRGEAEYAYAEANGRHQSDLALALLAQAPAQEIDGGIDAVFSYADFTAIKADPAYANGNGDAYTSEPCHGVAFFAGTRIDGPGMPAPLAAAARLIARRLKARRLKRMASAPPQDQSYFRRLYAAQGPKDILMEAGRKVVLGRSIEAIPLPGWSDPAVGELKRQAARGAIRQSAMVPTVLPLQVVTLGTLALVCCPGEFTTTAGRRVRDTVAQELAARGIAQVLLCTYCNDYMGYVTTYEEYQQQAYEGGHTIFGQWTLAAFQTRFAALAQELLKPEADRGHDRRTRPAPAPSDELARRSGLAPAG